VNISSLEIQRLRPLMFFQRKEDTLFAKIINTWKNDEALFLVHHSVDVDAVMALIIVYWTLNRIYDITIDDFVKKIKQVSSTHNVSDPHFGIDIGHGITDNSIKESTETIMIHGIAVTRVCASLYLAYYLLPKSDFDALKSILFEINKVDLNGTPSIAINYKINDPLSRLNPLSIWGMVGVLKDTRTLKEILTIMETIFASFIQYSINEGKNIKSYIEDTKLYKFGNYTVAATPLNAGRYVTSVCAKKLGASVIVFSSYDEDTYLGTIGVVIPKTLSDKINLRAVVPLTARFKEIDNLYISSSVIGRTEKSPFITTKELIESMVNELLFALKQVLEESNNNEEETEN